MPNWLSKLQPNPWLLRKLVMLAILIGVGVGSFFYGRRQHVDARTNTDLSQIGDGEYSRRAVAYLYNNSIPVTREELGEYLIGRFGAERLDFMINRKIVEMECKKYDITATDREVDERFQEDLKSFGGAALTQQDFVNNILRRFGKSLYEWKEDVIRPKIMMEKLVKSKIQITDADVKEGFEAKYGPRVECRMIVLDKNQAVAQKVLENARKGYAHFLEEARKQSIPNLAAEAGKVPAIHKHFGDKVLEDAAFRLKEGEVSGLLTMNDKDGTLVILCCEKHLPADKSVRFEDERQKMAKEMFELRLAQKIPEAFAKMREQATPRLVLNNAGQPSASVIPPPQPLPQPHHPITAKVDIPPPPVPQPITPLPGVAPLPDKLPMPEIKMPAVPVPTPTPTPMPKVAPIVPTPTLPTPTVTPQTPTVAPQAPTLPPLPTPMPPTKTN